jgi:hypothetical protein
MEISGKTTERFIFLALYTGIATIISWGGIQILNSSLESRYYKDFLLKWEVSLRAYDARGGIWPQFKGSNHLEYMDNLARLMRAGRISPPLSNRQRPYMYRIKKVGWRKKEDTFLLCLPDRIIIYGLSKETFDRLDGFIDETGDPSRGRFTGQPGKDGKTYIGRWRL